MRSVLSEKKATWMVYRPRESYAFKMEALRGCGRGLQSVWLHGTTLRAHGHVRVRGNSVLAGKIFMSVPSKGSSHMLGTVWEGLAQMAHSQGV